MDPTEGLRPVNLSRWLLDLGGLWWISVIPGCLPRPFSLERHAACPHSRKARCDSSLLQVFIERSVSYQDTWAANASLPPSPLANHFTVIF